LKKLEKKKNFFNYPMLAVSSRRRASSRSTRQVKKKTMKARSNVPEILLTFLGICIPGGLALTFAIDVLSLSVEHQVALACGAIALGSFLLSLAMSLHERSCCCTKKVLFSWSLTSIIIVLCLLVLLLELTDIFAMSSTILSKDRDRWSSKGFAVAGSLMLASFLTNWYWLCRCSRNGNTKSRSRDIGERRKKSKRANKNGFHHTRRSSSRRSSSRRSSSHTRSNRRSRKQSERPRSKSASAIVARVCENTGGGSKSMSHVVEMNSSWLNRSSKNRNRSRSRQSHARPLNLHSMSDRRSIR